MLSSNNPMFIALYMGVGGTLIYALKSIPGKVISKVKQWIIYTVKIYQYDELFEILELWLAGKYQNQYKDVEATLRIIDGERVPSTNNMEVENELHYRQEENTFIIKMQGKKLIVTKAKEKLEKAQNLKDVYFRKYTISGIRAKSQIDTLLKEAIKYAKEKKIKNTLSIYSNNQYGDWNNTGAIKIKPIEKTIFNREKKDFITNDVKNFLNSELWYTDTSIPYKRGYLLDGPPGTGKTTLALAIANMIHRNIYCLNLNSLESDAYLPRSFGYLPSNSILLIEDIDKVFSGRDNVKEDSKITFSSLLNCLDGAFYKHGLITIITTNHKEKLDPALIRSGRLDVHDEMPKPSCTELSEYVSLFFTEPVIIKGKFDLSMSDVQEICLSNRDSLSDAVNTIYKDHLQIE